MNCSIVQEHSKAKISTIQVRGDFMSLQRFFGHDINFELAMKPFTWQHYLLILLGIMCVVGGLLIADKIHNSRSRLAS